MKITAKEDEYLKHPPKGEERTMFLKGGKAYDVIESGTFLASPGTRAYKIVCEDGETRVMPQKLFFTPEEMREMKLKELGI
jgi:hypothetical protein